MEIYVSVGEWMTALQDRMQGAVDGDCFCLPTYMHLHAYSLLKEACFPERNFKVEVRESHVQ